MNPRSKTLAIGDIEICLPLPLLPIIEDVGWWQGEDGSASNQPYRNGFPRRHCLADYLALIRFARDLGVRLPIGMVIGEWDRTNLLASVAHATWLGGTWQNSRNQGPWLDEAAQLINDHPDELEIGLHGLCHEFWGDTATMERAEFHDSSGRMRAREVIAAHLAAFTEILRQNGFAASPRFFIPPALNHSFGNGRQSIQAILHDFGIRKVITRFARARRYRPPQHQLLGWECGVGLLERGLSPVSWSRPAATPAWDFSGPILPLHWGNLLHPDPARNNEVIDGWTMLLHQKTPAPQRLLAPDLASCWRQTVMWAFARLSASDGCLQIDRARLPADLPGINGGFFLTTSRRLTQEPRVTGARLMAVKAQQPGQVLELLPDKDRGDISIVLE
ncbi:MAG: hypothetical protein ACK5PS_11805 [Desulfopila sp.]